MLKEEFETEHEANEHLEKLQKRMPTSKHTVRQGAKSKKWHVIRHTSGGSHEV
jgi:hypothetical protein